MDAKPRSTWKAYSYAWVTLGFFQISLVGRWLFGWFACVSGHQAHAQPIWISDYLFEMSRDIFENWQAGGLAILLYVGSPQSKEGDDRMEAKIDEILRKVDPQNAESIIKTLDDDYAGRHTDARHAHRR
jgi:hypothetical protein